MKRENILPVFLLIFSLMLMAACKSDYGKGYKLKVEGESLAGTELQLLIFSDHTNSRPEPVDPDSKTDTRAEFTGHLEVPTFAALKLGDKQTGRFVLSNTAVKVVIDASEAKLLTVDGGEQQETKEEYDRIMQTDKKNKLNEEMRKFQRGSDEYNALLSEFRDLSKDDTDLQVKFIEDHPESIMSPYALWRIYSRIEEDEAIRLFHLIDISLQQQAHYVFISRSILGWEKTAIGSKVPDMSQNTPDGESVSLIDFEGNYLLIDFWASWCAPCREFNPEMVRLYNTYHDLGLEILGISLDKNAEDWKKAIADDDLVWHHVSDLKYWDNEISRYFGINSIPSTILVDRDGIIIARKLHGDELTAKLEQIFGE